MKEYDYVKVTVEKEKYARDGVHKGRIGWICDPRIIYNQRLVCFDYEVDDDDVICTSINESDLEVFWEAPVRQVGTRVLLYTDKYEEYGIKKGWHGVICEKGEQENYWRVRFDKESEDSEYIYFDIYQSHLAFE